MRSVRGLERKGASPVNETFLPLTESTTDWLHTIPIVGSTSSRAYIGLFKFRHVTPSGEFEFNAEQASADHPLLWKVRKAAADQVPQRSEYDWIEDLGEARYRILQPIPLEIKRVGTGNFEASFNEANIAMSGSDSNDAFQALVAEILDTLDLLLSEPSLGPDAAEQLRILRTYIVKT